MCDKIHTLNENTTIRAGRRLHMCETRHTLCVKVMGGKMFGIVESGSLV